MATQGNIPQNIPVSSVSRTITEQEKTEYVTALDDLCAVLEKYSAVLTKQTSIITSIREKADYLQITRRQENLKKH